MYITKFGNYTFPTQYELNETGGFSRRSNTEAVGGAGGAIDVFGSAPSPLELDTITRTIVVSAATPTALQVAVDELLGDMSSSDTDHRHGGRILVATLPDGTQRGTRAKCTEARFAQDYYHFDNAWLGPVSLTFERVWPVWWNYTDVLFFGDNLETFADTATEGYTFGQAVTEQALSSSSTTFTITNDGNARIFSGLIEFDGAIDTPTVTNAVNKYTFAVSRALVSGNRYTVNLSSYDVKLNGSPGYFGDLIIGTKRGQLQPMVLERGANEFTIVATGTPSCTFRYYFADTWS